MQAYGVFVFSAADGYEAVVMFFIAELVGFFVKIPTTFVFIADTVAHYFGQFGGAVRDYLFVRA